MPDYRTDCRCMTATVFDVSRDILARAGLVCAPLTNTTGRMRNPMNTSPLVAAVAAISMPVAAAAADDGWQFSLTPYLWLPTIDGQLKYDLPPGSGDPTVGAGPTDWFELLNYAVLVNGSVRRGRIAISSDFVYLSMSKVEDGRVLGVADPSAPSVGFGIPVGAELNLATRTDLDGYQWSIDVGYGLYRADRSHLDVFVGARYFSLDVSTSWNLESDIVGPGGNPILDAQGSASAGTELWDAIIGVRGRQALGSSRWSVPYNLDIGGGDSDSTLNAIVALDYGFDWGDLMFGYRHLEYDEGPDKLMQNFSFSGPFVGAAFRF